LEADNISLNFGVKQILQGIYVKAETNSVTGILGRNGSGKSSLLRIIYGDLTSKYKNIRIDGTYLKKNLYATGLAGYLPQHQLLKNSIAVATAFKLFQVSWDEFIVQFPSFKKYLYAKFQLLSTGEQRIIETYLILMGNHSIVLLDEPFSFIAPVYVEKIKTLIQRKKQHKIIMLTDHYYRDILEVSTIVYHIKNGYSKIIKSEEELRHAGYLT